MGEYLPVTVHGDAINTSIPTPLPGWSAMTLLARGVVLEGVAALCGVPIMFESVFGDKWYYWGGAWLALSFSSVVVGVLIGFRGYAKLKREGAAGYTTALGNAQRDMSLFLLHPVTFEVLLRPDQQRPQTIGKAIRIRDVLFGA